MAQRCSNAVPTDPLFEVDIPGLETAGADLCKAQNPPITDEAGLTTYINNQTQAPGASPAATLASLQAAVIDLQAKYDALRLLNRRIYNKFFHIKMGPG